MTKVLKATLKKSGIAKPKDLEGKVIAATAASAGRLMFDAFALAAGIDAKTISWQTVSGQLREPMLVRGDVAAVAGFTTSSVMSIQELGVPGDQIGRRACISSVAARRASKMLTPFLRASTMWKQAT